jgi:hypothetical protein
MNTHTSIFESRDSLVRNQCIGTFAPLAIATIALVTSAPAGAEEQWTWNLSPYLWATDVGVDVEISDAKVVDETIAFEDLLEDLERVVQIRVDGRHTRHGVALDLFDVELADTDDRVTLPGASGDELVLDTEIGMTILDLAGLYNPGGDGNGFSLLYGARVINERNELTAERQVDGIVLAQSSVDSNDTLVDAMVGVHFNRQLARHWTYQLSADVSTGDTELTWSVNPTIGYVFGADQRHHLLFGYERLVVDYDTADAIDMDMTMDGPLFAWRLEF